ncbi:MAG TPA: helix-turn-helix domain-containing protein, partial [Ktedonobacterales bacterium]|nr:helix-turn-helix domain-containing protein [Ktedonobacterales bacterium]
MGSAFREGHILSDGVASASTDVETDVDVAAGATTPGWGSRGRMRANAPTRAERLRAGSRERREHDRQELRQAILDTAAEMLLTQGYAAFSLRKVAERLGYSATTIYL